MQVVLWLARDMLIEEIGLYHPTRDATVTQAVQGEAATLGDTSKYSQKYIRLRKENEFQRGMLIE